MGERIAVVTGASRGIGREVARGLAERGFHVVAASRDPAAAAKGLTHARVEHVSLDVTERASIDALAKHLAGGLDVLVNNAGVSMQGFDAKVARGTLDVNFYGPMRVTDALLPAMRDGGRIVMVSSGLGALAGIGEDPRRRFAKDAITRDELVVLVEEFVRDVKMGLHGRHGWPSSAYNVSKVALNALTRIYARELASDPRRIAVNTCDPGWVRTDMGGPSAPRSLAQGARTPLFLATLGEGAPSGLFYRDDKPIQF